MSKTPVAVSRARFRGVQPVLAAEADWDNPALLEAWANQDLLQGETGADQFRYIAVSESTATAMDTISGFELGVDDISLSTIDAKPLVAGDQAFAFIGTAAFTAVGQVRIVESGGSTRVEVNTVGTSGAEMVILIDGVTGLLATDFIL